MLFAYTVSKYVNSNAIVLASGLRTVGIGIGQTSRIDSTKLAITKANKKYKGNNTVLASDGFSHFQILLSFAQTIISSISFNLADLSMIKV